jgi:hypothetical protein
MTTRRNQNSFGRRALPSQFQTGNAPAVTMRSVANSLLAVNLKPIMAATNANASAVAPLTDQGAQIGTKPPKKRRKWPIVLLIIIGLIGLFIIWAKHFVYKIGHETLGADIVYECQDMSRTPATELRWYYHIQLHPLKILEESHAMQGAADSQFEWSQNSIGHYFSGSINRITGKWERKVDGTIAESGVCKRIH